MIDIQTRSIQQHTQSSISFLFKRRQKYEQYDHDSDVLKYVTMEAQSLLKVKFYYVPGVIFL